VVSSSGPAAGGRGDVAGRLPLSTKIGFGLGNVAVMVGKQAPKALSLPIYNVALGVSPGWVSTILALGRVWDAFADPFIGQWSDRLQSRWGRRKPLILIGAVLTGVFFAMTWWFPRGLSPWEYTVYFAALSFLFYLGLAIFTVPWYAMGYELTPDYDERTRLQGIASMIGPAGQILATWLYPLTQQRYLFADTIDGVRVVGLIGGVVLIVFGLMPVFMVRERDLPPAAPVAKKNRPSLWQGMKAAANNRAFLLLTIAFTLVIIGTSLVGGLGFYVHTYYLYGGDTKLGGELTAQSTTIYLIIAVLFTPLVVKLSTSFGKKEVFAAALVWGLGRSLMLWWLLDPAHPWLALVNGLLWGFDNAAIFMLCHAMIADVCDLDELESGERREGLFGALYAWVFKTGLAAAFAVSGYLLVVAGFDRALGGAQSASTLFWMKFSYCGVPALFFIIALVVFLKYPITRAVADRVRGELEARKAAPAR
jgi:GPH family glycoside/pentoside/hexuronide:cation symporter